MFAIYPEPEFSRELSRRYRRLRRWLREPWRMERMFGPKEWL